MYKKILLIVFIVHLIVSASFSALVLNDFSDSTRVNVSPYSHFNPKDRANVLWTEWWYFNYFTPELKFNILYISSKVYGRSGILFWYQLKNHKPKKLQKWYPYGDEEIKKISSLSTFTLSKNKLQIAPKKAQILINLKDGANKYFLKANYFNMARQWHTGVVKYGRVASQWMDWRVGMPQALVKGKLKINKVAYNLKGIGYQDQNYGDFVILDNSGWEWFQARSGDYSIYGGLIAIQPNKYYKPRLVIQKKNKIIADIKKVRLKHLTWKQSKDGIYPDKVTIAGWAKDIKIRISKRFITNNAYILKNLPFPSFYIFQGPTIYDIELKQKNKILNFKGFGFSEFAKSRYFNDQLLVKLILFLNFLALGFELGLVIKNKKAL